MRCDPRERVVGASILHSLNEQIPSFSFSIWKSGCMIPVQPRESSLDSQSYFVIWNDRLSRLCAKE